MGCRSATPRAAGCRSGDAGSHDRMYVTLPVRLDVRHPPGAPGCTPPAEKEEGRKSSHSSSVVERATTPGGSSIAGRLGVVVRARLGGVWRREKEGAGRDRENEKD